MAPDDVDERVHVEVLDVGDPRLGAGSAHVLRLIRIAYHRRHRVASLREERLRQKRDLAVSAENNDACHGPHTTLAGTRFLQERNRWQRPP
ncbi:hypothetical protein GCM10009786_23840 [Leucobacter alluvii]|uniref:Uncharacterized protein n=1 Tax=Leucobacter alluvii TaxID=340321 RepID=A0ABN3B7G6_9MICO